MCDVNDALPVEQEDALFDEWLTSLATSSWSTSTIGSASRVSGLLAGRGIKIYKINLIFPFV